MAVWVLTGFMGCGKSSIGRAAAKMLGVGGMPTHEAPESFTGSQKKCSPAKAPDALTNTLLFMDLDEEIVRRCGRSIPEIFSTDGEEAFRAIERDTLASLLDDFHAFRAQKPPFHARSAEFQGCRAQNSHFYAQSLLQGAGVPPGGRATRGTEAGGPSALADGGVSEANSPRGNDPQPQLLIALGGGTLMSEECRVLVKKNAKCIYLRAKVETLAENLRADDVAGRPMLAGVDPAAPADAPDSLESRISSMMALRGPIYEKAADIILDIDGLDYLDIAQQILKIKSFGF